jgi:hypothetical protein
VRERHHILGISITSNSGRPETIIIMSYITYAGPVR